MVMDLKHKILAGLALALLAALGVVGSSWLSAHDAGIQLAAQLKADGEALKKLGEHEQILKAEAESRIAQIQADAARQKTPAQIAQWIPQQLPGLPQPIQITIPKQEPGQPLPPAEARIPQEDLQALKALISECQVCKVEREQAQGQLADEQQKNKLLAGERDAAVKAAKGGGFWQRAKKAAKWLGIGIVVGIVASKRL
jgi:hypothetical protein